VAELADALDLGSSAYGVGVRLPSSAPNKKSSLLILVGSSFYLYQVWNMSIFPLLFLYKLEWIIYIAKTDKNEKIPLVNVNK
jgi:hypothetical protein